MSFSPQGAMNSFVSTTRDFPSDIESLIPMLEHTYTEIAQAINFREIGTFSTQEILTGKSYQDPLNANLIRQSYRRVYSIGAIPQGGILDVPHNLVHPFYPTLIQGTCQTTIPDWRPLPNVGAWGTNLISVVVNTTNIRIENGADGPAIVSGYITLEYLYT